MSYVLCIYTIYECAEFLKLCYFGSGTTLTNIKLTWEKISKSQYYGMILDEN